MESVTPLLSRHVLIGTWRDSDHEIGSSIRFTVAASGAGFSVRAVDTYDGEELQISDVRWNGHVLHFTCLVPSTGRLTNYEMEGRSPSEVVLRIAYTEGWQKAEAD